MIKAATANFEHFVARIKQGICIKCLHTLAEFLHFAFGKTHSLKK